jgi:hypothetical protein
MTAPASPTKETRRPYPFINAFRPHVIDTLTTRKKQFPQPIVAPFVRLTSCKEDERLQYRFFTLGLHGYPKNSNENMFDLTYGNGKDIVGYGYSTAHRMTDENNQETRRAKRILLGAEDLTFDAVQLTSTEERQIGSLTELGRELSNNQQVRLAAGAFPIPGITGVKVSRDGLGYTFQAEVTFQCYGRQQLEFLRNHFMVAGTYAVIEWGHASTADGVPEGNLLDFSDSSIVDELTNCLNNGRDYVLENYVIPSNGNYDFLVGSIGSYDLSFDAEKNITSVTVVIISKGELAWGFDNITTTVDINKVKKPGEITNITDYFKDDASPFNEFLFGARTSQARQDGRIILPTPSTANQNIDTGGTLNKYAPYVADSVLIRWDFFIDDMISDMFSQMDTELAKKFESIFQFSRFQRENREKYASGFALAEDTVGYSPGLKSTDPEVMILWTEEMPAYPFSGGRFGRTTSTMDYGVLGEGVYINAGAIKEAFSTTTNFMHAFRNLLMKMNGATGNFWALQIFYDEERNRVRIIDQKHGDVQKNAIPIYRFNVGAVGEALNLDLSAAFPPELKTQMYLAAQFKTEKKEERADLLRKFPLIGTTSHFAFALNWTNLTDVLMREVQPAGETQDVAGGVQKISPIASGQSEQPTSTRQALAGGQLNVGVVVAHEGDSGKNVAVGTPRNTTTPVAGDAASVRKIKAKASVPGAEANRVPSLTKRDYDNYSTYQEAIFRWSKHYGVDPYWIRAIMKVESTTKNGAFDFRAQPIKNGKPVSSAYGLGQIVKGTLFDQGTTLGMDGTSLGSWWQDINLTNGKTFASEAEALAGYKVDPEIQVQATCRVFRAKYEAASRRPFDGYTVDESAIIRYGPGRPGDRDGLGTAGVDYLNRVKAARSSFALSEGITDEESAIRVAENQANQSPISSPVGNVESAAASVTGLSAQQKAQYDKDLGSFSPTDPASARSLEQNAKWEAKFGHAMLAFIEPNKSDMISRLVRYGLSKTPPQNNCVAPFPTTATIEITILGLSGISISDAFTVDKLPFIFDDYGVFQITAVTEQLDTTAGWTSKLRGIFRMMWFDGRGQEATRHVF